MTQSRFKRMLIKYLPTVFSVIVLLVFWQYACEYYKISENLIPTPSSIVQSTADALPTLLPAALITTQETVIGFSIAIVVGILLGVIFHVCKLVKSALFPLLCAAQTMPLISIAPIF